LPAGVSTDTVLTAVTVTGPDNAPVLGIERSRFHIFEDGVEQTISHFREDNGPWSVGFLIDNSSSMDVNNKIDLVRDGFSTFLQTKKPEDEFFIAETSPNPHLVVNYTNDASKAKRAYLASGATPLYDGIYVGLEVLKEAAYPRRALIVITDAGETASGFKETAILERAIRQTAQVYPIVIADTISNRVVEEGISTLELLARVTGGRKYEVLNSSVKLEIICAEIARYLKTQYSIGYAGRTFDGNRHELRVTVDVPPGSPKLTITHRSAWLAPKLPAGASRP
jgi:Ca-activated chloride channel family protein